MQSLRALMLLPTSWYICEYMQEGWFLHTEDGVEETVTFNISLHSIPMLYYTMVKGNVGDVFFFTNVESAQRGGNIAFCVPGAAVARLLSPRPTLPAPKPTGPGVSRHQPRCRQDTTQSSSDTTRRSPTNALNRPLPHHLTPSQGQPETCSRQPSCTHFPPFMGTSVRGFRQ